MNDVLTMADVCRQIRCTNETNRKKSSRFYRCALVICKKDFEINKKMRFYSIINSNTNVFYRQDDWLFDQVTMTNDI